MADWRILVDSLRHDPLDLLGLWADTSHIHALFLAGQEQPLLASVAVEAGAYPALSPVRPGAAWFERAIGDLWGHEATGGVDTRPWLDHGRWPQRRPMSLRPAPAEAPEPPEFLAEATDDTHQVPFGPIGGAAAGLDGAAHLRLTVAGDTILHAEALGGYGHRGVMVAMRGRTPRAAAPLAARLASDSAVAHAAAFARAAEAALAMQVPPRAEAIRAAALELERVAGLLGALEAIADTVAAPCASGFGVLRELVLRGCDAAFGQRLMLDTVVPGGVSADLAPDGIALLRRTLDHVAAALPGLERRCAGLLRRAEGLGVVPAGLAALLGAGGIAGRASGRDFDARRLFGPAPVATLLQAGLLQAGDAAARIRLRLHELPGSLDIAASLLDGLLSGEVAGALPPGSGEGAGVAEGARGDCWAWLVLDAGTVASVFLRDPGWAVWPLLEMALRGERVESVSLIARSLGCTMAGMDL
jgi:Ni,Fe-hydrogenase III large subunit